MAPGAAPSAGRLLRQAREAAGLHVAALAVSLKVPVRKLEALEEDRWDQLPDAVFARALASSVCRTLKIDPQPVLERLPQSSTPRLVPEREAINAPFRAPGDVVVPGWREHLARPTTLAVAALLVGALILIFLPTVRREEAATAKPETTAAPMAAPVLLEPASAPSDGVPPAVVTAPAEPSGEPGSTPAAAAGGTASVATAAAPPTATPVTASSVAAAPAQPASAPAAMAVPPGSLVVFKTSGPSWVEVVDARGQVALRRLMAAGETAGAVGSPPLAITVGSASATAVEVRGKRFDLAPVARDNVARFEVK